MPVLNLLIGPRLTPVKGIILPNSTCGSEQNSHYRATRTISSCFLGGFIPLEVSESSKLQIATILGSR